MAQDGRPAAWWRALVPAGTLSATLCALWLIWGGFLPNGAGRLGVDYAFWLPSLLAGTFWHLGNSWFAVPWFLPSHCAGVPWQADPQGAYVSLPQLLTFGVGPLRAVRMAFLAYAAIGFVGTYGLAGRCFGCSRPASLLAACLFTLNGFYAARMMVGHLSFAPFMLLPALAGCAGGWGAARPGWRPVLLFALLLAAMLESGAAVLVLPVFLSLACLVVMRALATGSDVQLATPAIGAALGLALCAGKLAAVFALMAHVPRDSYPLPGFGNMAVSTWMAFRCLFLWPTAAMTGALVNSALTLEPHEFDYRVGPVPLLLMAAGWLAWRREPGAPATRRARLLWEALAVLLVIPLALNTHAPLWTAFLKHVPILRSASSLLRWFAAYMLPAVIGGALALDRLLAAGRARWLGAAAGVAATLACLLLGDRAGYGPAGLGVYDPAPVETGWRAAVATGRVPAITALAVVRTAAGQPDISVARENLLTQGISPLFCYDPLFGYRLEALKQGTLHAGPILDATSAGGRLELNLKNPACYVFPGANGCAPGDPFLAAQRGQAQDFAAYRTFAFAAPWWARGADWVGMLTLGGMALLFLATLVPRRRA